MAEKQRPSIALRIGALSATVWANKRDSGATFYSVQFDRSYRDSDEQWQRTNYFSHSDLLNLARLAERAEAWIAGKQQVSRDQQGDAPASDDDLPF